MQLPATLMLLLFALVVAAASALVVPASTIPGSAYPEWAHAHMGADSHQRSHRVE